MTRILPAAFGILIAGSLSAFANVLLPAIFSDGMVLQRSAATPVWGRADANEDVEIEFGALKAATHADAAGDWRINLDLSGTGKGPFELKVTGKNTIDVKDVLVGQVWLCSGQSNMQFTLNRALNADTEIAGSENPQLRQFTVPTKASPDPAFGGAGRWMAASPATSGSFSAVAYFFGKKIQGEMHEPVGLIDASVGGTPVEAWTSTDALQMEPDLKAKADQMIAEARTYPDQKKAYAGAFLAWSRKYGREDRNTPGAEEYAGDKVSDDGWQPVTLPAKLSAAGLPDAGAIWLRRKIDLPEDLANKDLRLLIDEAFQFDTVYWNGQRIGGTTLANYKGDGSGGVYGVSRNYPIPASLARAGENTVAIRLFSASGDMRIGRGHFDVKYPVKALHLDGQWMARPEFVLPELQGVAAAEAPVPLKAPPLEGHVPTTLFYGMIHPLIPYGIKGVLWYQGEANVERAWEYRKTFLLMINGWRELWKLGNFPFYFCQLANFQAKSGKPGDSAEAELREAQSMALALPNTGQAVLIDLGEAGDIHPRNKQTVGERLAAIALARDYGKSIPYSGPVCKSMSVEGGKIRIHFTSTDGGLVAEPLPATYLERSSPPTTTKPLVPNSPKSPLEGFAICGGDHHWVWANAHIEGDSVVVESPSVTTPVAVRYAWADNPSGNLYNGAGFPASPFRTDDFAEVTKPK